jgi:carbon-monoxide dehydrogenase medium subunit
VKPPPFEYAAPGTVEEAVALLAQRGDEAKVLAGGQSLMPLLAFRVARPSLLVDVNRIAELDYLRLQEDVLVLGALARHRDVERLPELRERCPLVSEAVEQVGHVAIRNRGTAAGSLVHADPVAEWPAVALALEAELTVVGPRGRRSVRAVDFFVGCLETVIEPDELLTEVRFPLPSGRSGSCFLELARRHGDFAIAGAAVVVTLGGDNTVVDARIVVVGDSAKPVRVEAAEEVLRGASSSEQRQADVAAAVDRTIRPGDDVHATGSYRRQAAQVLTQRAVAVALARARGGAGA